MQTDAIVHIYANGRRFVIVPVISSPGGELIELDAVQTVPLTLGRPTVVRLSRALRAAVAASLESAPDVPRWDGEKGRWWSHHLLGLTAKWKDNRITLSGLDDDGMAPVVFPADTPEGDLSEQLIALLSGKLHAA